LTGRLWKTKTTRTTSTGTLSVNSAGCSDAGIVYLFDGKTGKLKLTVHNPMGAAGRGNWFGYVHRIAGVNGDILAGNHLFDGSTGKLLRTFNGSGPAGSVGNNVVLGSSVFDAKTGELLLSFPAPSGKGGGPVAFGNDVLIATFGSRVSLFAGPDTVGSDAGAPSGEPEDNHSPPTIKRVTEPRMPPAEGDLPGLDDQPDDLLPLEPSVEDRFPELPPDPTDADTGLPP